MAEEDELDREPEKDKQRTAGEVLRAEVRSPEIKNSRQERQGIVSTLVG